MEELLIINGLKMKSYTWRKDGKMAGIHVLFHDFI